MMQIRIGGEILTITDRKQEKSWRRFLKLVYKHDHGGRPARKVYSMMERPRIKAGFPDKPYDENADYDYWTEYGFFNADGWTDEEIQERIDDMRYIVRSPYDCTGKPTTCYISWHKNPTGLVSYIHLVGLDV